MIDLDLDLVNMNLRKINANKNGSYILSTVSKTSLPFLHQVVHLELTDTPGQEEYAQMRVNPFSGSQFSRIKMNLNLSSEAEVFLVCFSLVNRDSYENVKNKWMPEIR